jgi:hypothetical protein
LAFKKRAIKPSSLLEFMGLRDFEDSLGFSVMQTGCPMVMGVTSVMHC